MGSRDRSIVRASCSLRPLFCCWPLLNLEKRPRSSLHWFRASGICQTAPWRHQEAEKRGIDEGGEEQNEHHGDEQGFIPAVIQDHPTGKIAMLDLSPFSYPFSPFSKRLGSLLDRLPPLLDTAAVIGHIFHTRSHQDGRA